MKKGILSNLVRGALVILAYKEFVHPKGGMIPPGTGRTTAQYLKSSFQIAKGWLSSHLQLLKKQIAS